MLAHDRHIPLLIAAQLGAAALLLAGCASRPESLDRAQTAVSQAMTDPDLQKYASDELERARQAMQEANQAAAAGAETADLDSKAYVVQRQVEVARATKPAVASSPLLEPAERNVPVQ